MNSIDAGKLLVKSRGLLSYANGMSISIANASPDIADLALPPGIHTPDDLPFHAVFDTFGNSLQSGQHFLKRGRYFGHLEMFLGVGAKYRAAHRARILCDRDDVHTSSAHIATTYRSGYAVGTWAVHIHDCLDSINTGAATLAQKWLVLKHVGVDAYELAPDMNNRREQYLRAFVATLTRNMSHG